MTRALLLLLCWPACVINDIDVTYTPTREECFSQSSTGLAEIIGFVDALADDDQMEMINDALAGFEECLKDVE